MAYTTTDLANLQAALTNPEQRIRFQGKDITLRSVDEIQEMISVVQKELDTTSGTERPRRMLLYQRSPGF